MHSNLHQTWVVCDIICVFWLAFIWKRNSVCRLLKINRQWWKIAVPKCQIFIRPFVFSKTIRQVKAGQNKKYYITKTLGLVQLWMHCTGNVFLTQAYNQIFTIFQSKDLPLLSSRNLRCLWHQPKSAQQIIARLPA